MQNPDDYVAWSATHTELPLFVFGVTRRKLALVKVQGLVGAHGFSTAGWQIQQTVTLWPNSKAITSEAKRSLARRTHAHFPIFYQNDHSLHRQVFGCLDMFRMSASDANRVMQGVRSDIRQYAAATA